MNGQTVTISGTKLPYSHSYFYRIAVDYEKFDSFVSTAKLTTQQMLDVQSGYQDAIDSMTMTRIESLEEQGQSILRHQAVQNRRRIARAAE